MLQIAQSKISDENIPENGRQMFDIPPNCPVAYPEESNIYISPSTENLTISDHKNIISTLEDLFIKFLDVKKFIIYHSVIKIINIV